MMPGSSPLWTSHPSTERKVLLEVNEEETQAAAVTTVHTCAAASVKLLLIVDQPFLFLMVDRASGVILFMGRLPDPLRKA
jgi:serine protease inhibitor